MHPRPVPPQSRDTSERDVPPALCDALVRMGLASAGDRLRGAPLSGGVSSDIWRIELDAGPACVKRALPRLRVNADWRVPVERNRFEVAWMRQAAAIVPEAVPAVLGEDAESCTFAMACLDSERFPAWKVRLFAGEVDSGFAGEVGRVLGRIHAATADRDDVASRFRTDANFHAIRLEPYLLAAAGKHPHLGEPLAALARTTADTRRALVHGDVSPKNILAGPAGPVFLDAECAWFGDPAFDLAFCLNHLLLKGLVLPAVRPELWRAFEALCDAYFEAVSWEPAAALEARAAHLLPGLLLARVDGKSPVEYLDSEGHRERVRRAAAALLRRPVKALPAVREAWVEALTT